MSERGMLWSTEAESMMTQISELQARLEEAGDASERRLIEVIRDKDAENARDVEIIKSGIEACHP